MSACEVEAAADTREGELDAAVAVLSAAVAAGAAQVLVDLDAGRTLVRTTSGVTVLEPAGMGPGEVAPAALSETVELPTRDGLLRAVAIDAAGETAAAVLVGRLESTNGAIVYLHRGCVVGDALGHVRCPRRQALEVVLAAMRRACAGVVLYTRDETQLGACCLPTGAPERPVSPAVLGGFRAVLAPLELTAVQVVAAHADQAGLADALGLDVDQVVEP